MTTINEKVYIVLTKPEFWIIVSILAVIAAAASWDCGVRFMETITHVDVD